MRSSLSTLAAKVFFGSDEGEEEVRDKPVTQNFARSMSLQDAMDSSVLLCYEVNGEPLPTAHGFPIRLVAPGWYGVANVKWLKRIEIRDMTTELSTRIRFTAVQR